MTYLNQQMLTPTKHVEEIATLNAILAMLGRSEIQEAKLACMGRLILLERVSSPTLVEYRQEAAA